MLPTTSSNLTYDDVFRLLRERHMPTTNAQTKTTSDAKGKTSDSSKDAEGSKNENQQENLPTPATDANVTQQMQLLLMLRLLGKLPMNAEGTALNLPGKQNAGVTLTQDENITQKKSGKTKVPLQSSLAINVDQKKEGKGAELTSKTKSEGKIKDFDTQNEDPSLSVLDPKSKKIRKMNTCGHPERAHYAKNMCNQCYHKHGRTKKPWRCNHDRLYAHGLCQNCYINAYNKKRSLKSKEDEPSSVATPNMELEGEGGNTGTASGSPRSLPSGTNPEDASNSIETENEGNVDEENLEQTDDKKEELPVEEIKDKAEEKEENKEKQ